jgi:hypothetical protein
VKFGVLTALTVKINLIRDKPPCTLQIGITVSEELAASIFREEE